MKTVVVSTEIPRRTDGGLNIHDSLHSVCVQGLSSA